MRYILTPRHGLAISILIFAVFAGCDSNSETAKNDKFVTLGTAPIGGAFQPVGNAIASVANEFKGDNDWKIQAKGTKGSRQNIRDLDKGEIQLAMSNAAISYHAARGIGDWDRKYDIRAVVTLAPNIGLFIAKSDSGIKTMADLKGKRIAVGPAGAGFDTFLGPLLTAHGVTYMADEQDFIPLNVTYEAAVQLLCDENVDAAFMGGAIPTSAVTQACTTNDIYFIPYDEEARAELIKKYEFFTPARIPAKNKDGNATYRGLENDFEAMNVGSMHLITQANVADDLIYNLTKTIWENRKEIVKQHNAANAINESNAARNTGIDFHPGAIRFYREIGIWPDDDNSTASAATENQPAASE